MMGDDDDMAGLFAGMAGAPNASVWGAVRSRGQQRQFDEYLKAYSMAMLPGKARDNVSYGGKIIMPPSALARLSALDLESPWMFQLRNPSNPAASTHGGVLEFIADEGCVHLPHWMMKTLRLNEGDIIRITSANLPKGKFVKLQAQTKDFLEVSDPKAVLEQALRNFSTLTQGDIIEIVYNSIVFGMLVMEIKPETAGISIYDTDLEVDFAPPVGYVEPPRPARAPVPTMASKLKIDLNSSSPGSSRPGSAMGTATGGDGGWESFKGKGETLNGRKTKGKGKSVRKIEEVADGSKIYRTDKTRMMTTDSLETDVKVPAALNLPFGKLFFGFPVVPFKTVDDTGATEESAPTAAPASGPVPTAPFGGTGNTLSGRASRQGTSNLPPPSSASTSAAAPSTSGSWGGQGQMLGGRATGPKPKKKPAPPRDDVIEIDSD